MQANDPNDQTRTYLQLAKDTIVGHYRIIEKIGAGGMGEVYLAEDTKLNRKVALKFLPVHACQDVDRRARFTREAQAAAKLNHPNIVTIYEVSEFNGRPFFAMENVEGQTFRHLGKSKELPLSRIIELAIQVSEGLAKAHTSGIVHRDIKPSNILIDQDGRAKIVDFGLASVLGSEHLTKTGSTLGTVGYMSPEQARGEEADARSDLFSFGVVLYELITGRAPFKAESDIATVKNIVEAVPEPLARYKNDVPDDLQRIIDKLLSKDRRLRYQHADDVATDLKRLISAVSSGPIPVRRKRRMLMPSIALLVVVAAAVVIFKPWRLAINPSTSNLTTGKTIAVLPFANLSGNPEDEYFTDGIMEDILTQLSKIGELTVISRTTMIQYKGSKKALQEIAGEVHAGTVLEGSVRRSGNRLRISSQLINAGTDGHIWADTYDRDMQDVFAIQSEIAQRIAEALRVTLTQGQKERILKPPTANMEAYSYYLKGREYYYRYRPDYMRTAVDLFGKAVALDSNYSLAWAGMSDASCWLGVLDSAMIFCRKAIALDETSAEAQRALGFVYFAMGFIDSSLTADLKAVELNPSYFTGHFMIGCGYAKRGELCEALPWFTRAVSISPTYPNPYGWMGRIFSRIGEYDKAEQVLKKGLELQGDNIDVLRGIVECYLSHGKDLEAKALVERVIASDPNRAGFLGLARDVALMTDELSAAKEFCKRRLAVQSADTTPNDSGGGTLLGYVLIKEGDHAGAEKILSKEVVMAEEDIRKGEQGGTPEYVLALVSAMKGDKGRSCTHLKKAIDGGVRTWQLTLRDPRFENVRDEAEFKRLIALMKAKVDEQKKCIDEMEKEEGR